MTTQYLLLRVEEEVLLWVMSAERRWILVALHVWVCFSPINSQDGVIINIDFDHYRLRWKI